MVTACYLQQQHYHVTVYEKNSMPGGRARQFSQNGFVFDMGPSWYWMPDVFESFFNDFGKSASDYYTLERLDPSYSIYFKQEKISLPASIGALQALFEELEPGSGARLLVYLRDAAEKYQVGMHRFAGKASLHLSEFMSRDILSLLYKLQPFRNMQQHVNRYFKHPMIRKIMQFPVIFLGAMPDRIPAMYSLMNYADTVLGTWYPLGGMYEVIKGVYSLARELGVKFCFNSDVEGIDVIGGRARVLHCNGEKEATDLVIGAGDYHHMEQLLSPEHRQYSMQYWGKKEMAPSCLLYFLGIDKRLPLDHHTLFFDTSFDKHAQSLYDDPQWPEEPLFYVCAPSVTDASVAPAGCENLFILIPVASGLEGDGPELRQQYLDGVLERLEKRTGTSIKENIIFQKHYALQDFKTDYHAFRGNAYGLANTLKQTAFGKPRMRSSKVENLFFCGQLTVPGPGLPPAFLSGRTAATEAVKYMKANKLLPNILNNDANEYHLSF
jgi:phytoene desaturase